MLKCLLAWILLVAGTGFSATEIPFGKRLIERVSDSGGKMDETQVWSITCSGDEDPAGGPRVFFSSVGGMFVYDGARLEKHPGPANLELRNIKYDPVSKRVYSAGNIGFGWWESNEYGFMVYHAIETADHGSLNQDFWRVHISGYGEIFFQGLGRLCIYTPRSGQVKTILPTSQFRYMHCLGGEIFVQDGDMLCKMGSDGAMQPVCRVKDRIMDMIRCGGHNIAAIENTGLMEFDGNSLTPMHEESNRTLAAAKILSIAQFDETHMIVGTTQKGYFITDCHGRLCDTGESAKQALYASVISLSKDANGDVWIGTEAGVSRIDNSSQDYYLEDSRLGRVRSVREYDDGLVIGSNKGVFYYKDGQLNPVQGTTGPVWNIEKLGGRLYIAHDRGLLVLKDPTTAVPVHTGTGVLSIARCHNDSTFFVCGTYDGLALFQLKEGRLHFESLIGNYDGFCRYMHLDMSDRLWIRDGQKGFIRLTLNEGKTEVADRKDFDIYQRDGDILYFIELNGKMLMCRNRDTYMENPDSGNLERRPELDYLLSDFEREYGKVPGFSDVNTGPFALKDGGFCFGKLNGIRISYGQRPIRQAIYVSHIEMLGIRKRSYAKLDDGREKIPYDMNTIRIFVAGNTNNNDMEYRMDGADNWVAGNIRYPLQLSSLGFGKHIVEFRLPDAPEVGCSIRLYIGRPWYLEPWALIAYVLLIFLIIKGLMDYSRREGRKEEERRRLREELKDRSKELANITFNNARRNSQLNEIKGLLTKGDSLHKSDEVARVSRETVALINSYLEDESDWEKSEEYFNIIYDGLLDKLKRTYPGISKTDLKICVYTKLNLSTKEMADLMNISVRSVEVARWRLRKRLGLPQGEDISTVIKEIDG